MPSKQKSKPKGSAPTNRIYKSVEPLDQTTFPEKKKRVTRGYGKKSAVKPDKQDTLTQMDWVKLYEKEALEKEREDDIEDSEGDYEQEESKRKTKRRRTMGDEPTVRRTKTSKNRRKTLGEEEKTPGFSTQTITQLDYWPLSGASKELEDDPSIYDIPMSSSTVVQPPRRSPRNTSQPAAPASTGLMPRPQTPKHSRALEIPSSQSPVAPTSSRFGGSAQRRSPLREQSANIVVPFSLRSKTYMSAEKLPILKVEDTFETGTDESQVVRTPSKHSSPPKTVRFAVPEPSPEPSPVNTPIKQEPTSQRNFSPSIRRGKIPAPKNIKFEILDSDAEDEEDEESQIIADTPIESISGYEDLTNVRDADENIAEPGQDDTQSDTGQTEGDEEEELEPRETFYGDIGAETQFQAERIMSSSYLSDAKEDTPPCEDIPKIVPYGGSQYQQSQNPTTQHTQTQRHRTRLTQTYTQFGKSQYPESQRLSTQQIDAMAPRSGASDIFICIYPTHVENIISRKKNHEFRSYNFPSTVSRIWIYQTKPVSTLTHMAVISAPKSPGEIKSHDGLGNAEFNKGDKRSKVAYEILELYALANPMTLEELKSRQWFKAVPQKYARVPPAVLGELIANLLPPLFVQSSSSLSPLETDASEGTHSTPILHRKSTTSTESQEVQDQITNNIQQFTQAQAQAPPSSPPLPTLTPAIHVPSSQNRSVKLSQASSVDYTQTQTPITSSVTHVESSILEVIPESPMSSRSIPSSSRGSSPVLMLPPVVSRRVIEVESQNEGEDEGEEDSWPVAAMAHKRMIIEIESQSGYEDDDEENVEDMDENKGKDEGHSHHIRRGQEEEANHSPSTPLPYSLIHSSQIMSRSQMMREQDSLMEEEIMGPLPSTMHGLERLSWDEGGDEEL